MAKRGRPKLPLAERFWSRVKRGRPDECWEWQRASSSSGYGQLLVDGRQELVHRLSWALRNGPVPDGMCVLHHCDNKICVNPDHLFIGTHQDNTDDYLKKNGGRKHPKHPKHPLTKNRLASYRRKAALTQQALSELSGISYRTIQDQEAGIPRSPNLKTARRLIKALSKELGRKIAIDDVWPE